MKKKLQTKVSDRGHVSVPADIRSTLGIKSGTVLEWELSTDGSARVSVMRTMQDTFLANLGISVAQKFPIEVMNSAYKAWCDYKGDHPGASGPGSAFDSLYIGAFALLYDGILTRQGDLYRRYYPSLPVIEPVKVESLKVESCVATTPRRRREADTTARAPSLRTPVGRAAPCPPPVERFYGFSTVHE